MISINGGLQLLQLSSNRYSLLATWSAELSASHGLIVSKFVINPVVSSHSLTTQLTQVT